MEKEIHVYTDGACQGNPGPGAWAALILNGEKEEEIAGFEAQTTNNRMELMAPIKVLELLQEASIIHIHTDSLYVKDGITNWINAWKEKNWRRADGKPIKNIDLWERLDTLAQARNLKWHWVRGHNGHVENERVDRLAKRTIAMNMVANQMNS